MRIIETYWNNFTTFVKIIDREIEASVQSLLPFVSKINNGYGDRNLVCKNEE